MLHYNALHTNMFTGSIVEWVDLNSSELHWLRWFHCKVLDDEEDPLFRTSSDPLGGQCQLAAMEWVKRFQTCQPESPGTWEKPTLEANLTLVGSVNFFPLAKSNHRVFDFWDYQKLGSIAKQLGQMGFRDYHSWYIPFLGKIQLSLSYCRPITPPLQHNTYP